jgi:hypothetical protein
MGGVIEKVLPHLESMEPNSILDRVNDIEKYDRMAHRNYGLFDDLRLPGSRRASATFLSQSLGRRKISHGHTA